eukprot:6212706-Pleurochrysis_carterae.AAC.1
MRHAAQLSRVQPRPVLRYTQLGLSGCERWEVRTTQRGHGDVTAADVASAQSASFRRNSEAHRGAIRAREQRGAGVLSAGCRLSVGRSEGTTVRHLVSGLLRLARTVAVPVLTAAVAASTVLRRPRFLERVGPVVPFRVATFAIRLGVLVLLDCVAFREEGTQNVTDRCERGREPASGGCERDLDIQESADVLADATYHVRQLLRHDAFGDTLMRRQRAVEAIVDMVKGIEGPQRVVLQPGVEVRLHHGLDGHASGCRSIVRGSTDNAYELSAARIAVVT